MSATKSPLPGVPDQQAYERLLQGLGADMYRQIPIAFDPAQLPRGIPIDPGTVTGKPRKYVNKTKSIALNHLKLLCPIWTDISFSSSTAAYYLPRHLAPNPAYPHPYPYLIRSFPDTTALENRQTLLNDYITSQQMHQWPPAAAMAAQRSDILRGLNPRDQALSMTYSAPRGKANRLHPTVLDTVSPVRWNIKNCSAACGLLNLTPGSAIQMCDAFKIMLIIIFCKML